MSFNEKAIGSDCEAFLHLACAQLIFNKVSFSDKVLIMEGFLPQCTRNVEIFVGTTFWRCAPHLVSTSLYQAVQKTKETREPTEVEYVSPVTHSWLHVYTFGRWCLPSLKYRR